MHTYFDVSWLTTTNSVSTAPSSRLRSPVAIVLNEGLMVFVDKPGAVTYYAVILNSAIVRNFFVSIMYLLSFHSMTVRQDKFVIFILAHILIAEKKLQAILSNVVQAKALKEQKNK